jgi:hypothetical protein
MFERQAMLRIEWDLFPTCKCVHIVRRGDTCALGNPGNDTTVLESGKNRRLMRNGMERSAVQYTRGNKKACQQECSPDVGVYSNVITLASATLTVSRLFHHARFQIHCRALENEKQKIPHSCSQPIHPQQLHDSKKSSRAALNQQSCVPRPVAPIWRYSVVAIRRGGVKEQ